jgi:nitrogen fixation NifU-like protein
MSDLRALYQEIILEHNKNPRNFKKLEGATRILEGFNPLCGDRYTVYIKLEGSTIADLAFQGSGCAISKASASLMTTLLKGKSIEEARSMFSLFHDVVTGVLADVSFERLGKLAAFGGVSEFPARVKCASLAWHTMRNALESKTETVSTE